MDLFNKSFLVSILYHNRALRVNKLMSEALKQLLLIKFIDTFESQLLQQVHNETTTLSL